MFRPTITLAATLLVAVAAFAYNLSTWHPQGTPLQASAAQNANLLNLTGTSARLSGENYLRTAVSYSQAIYAAAQDKDRPGAVVLVRDDDPAVAMASTRLQHFPVNAPMLYVTNEGNTLPKETREELERLGPEGVMMDGNVKVYLVGDINPSVAEEVERIGMKTRQIYADDPIEYTEVLDEFLATMEANHADRVLIASLDALPYAYGASNWNAHMGQGFAFVTEDGIPDETRRILKRRSPNYAYIYVFAPPDVVGPEIMRELTRYGHVQRIPGSTPQEMAVRWAGYKDLGRVYGWWFGKFHRDTGWGYAEPGHNLLLGSPNDWRVLVPSGVLSHMGKHAMLVLTNDDGSIPDPLRSYLGILQPTITHPSQQLYTYAWVLGDDVSDETMREFSDMIAVEDLREVQPRNLMQRMQADGTCTPPAQCGTAASMQ